MCTTMELTDGDHTQDIFILSDDFDKFDPSRHTKIVVFKANGELLTDKPVIEHVEVALGLRQPQNNNKE